MFLLIVGIVLWVGAHMMKRVAPNTHARLGASAPLVVTVALVLAIVLMTIGYRNSPTIQIWQPPSFLIHLNNLLMLAAFFILGTAHTKGRLRGWTRHPMLISAIVWSVAHLLVNGDVASIVLFGSMLAWAIESMIIINRAEPDWQRPEPGTASRDVVLVVITLVTFGIAAGIHIYLGYWPFPA